MGIHRNKWLAAFRASDSLLWSCPACGVSPLRLVADTLKTGETRDSKAAQDHPGSEPEQIDGRFACLMDCGHCGNVVGAAGTYAYHDDRHWDEVEGATGDYEKYYSVKYFTESPHLLEIPEATPDAVTGELLASFQLYWSDPLACTNRIRSSVEKLLTAERVQQTPGRILPKGRRKFLSLHDRIERYAKKRPDIAKKLMALKWIGNAGSHSKGAIVDDALDGYVLMDWVLDALYAKRHKEASALTSVINRRKAPRSPRRTPRKSP